MNPRSLLACKRLLPLLLLLFCRAFATAQCTNSVSTFPYSQDFEATDGDWVTGGNASDWVWGTPAKRVISAASSGIRCWVTGGLQNTRYNDNENSWLMSPCFDFTGLTNPYLRIRLFWETEKKYDGATLEYTTDGGGSWHTLGSAADNTTCPGNNWFNTPGITSAGADGWSGNIQATAPCPGGAGGGSGMWVSSGHALNGLAGRSNVRFRFRFTAGSRCNDYDGFAVDDIWIGQLQGAASAAFSFSCTSARSVSFLPITATCGNSYTWDFGDPSTGSSNTSSLANPSHTFSNTGTYNVTLTVRASDGSTAATTQTVRIIEVAPELLRPVTCSGGHDAEMIVRVSPAGSYQYNWSATPAQNTATATGLGAGSYVVDITAPDACPNRTSVTIANPPPITHTQAVRDARCGGANGGVLLAPNGGAYPYLYDWSPAVDNDSVSNTLLPGPYSVVIRDDRGCTDTARFTIASDNNFQVSLGADTVLCIGETLLLYPGPQRSYQWQDGSTDSSFLVTETGAYSVRVTDQFGCTGSATVRVSIDCSDVYFPDAFSPNNDGRNDAFGPLGNRASLTGYRLQVYGRWGQLVFSSTNPFEKWDARNVAGGNGSQVFVWVAQYRLMRREELLTRKGTVLVVR